MDNDNKELRTDDNSSRRQRAGQGLGRPQRRRILWLTAMLAAALVVLGLLGGVKGFIDNLRNNSAGNRSGLSERQTPAKDGNLVAGERENDIISVVNKVSPVVVSILTAQQRESFLGSQTREGAGTGIIVGKDGYVLTNKHVVSGADTVNVVLSDGTTYDNVRVLGTDPLNDIAFLKIPDVNNLPAAELGDSSTVRVGQSVIAIGNSLGQYQNTVTTGIISGTGRPVSASSEGGAVQTLTDLLQTDAAINPGNSGGPLLNMEGQVIGINTAVAANAQGIGFAIPINATKGILKGVLSGGPVRRAYLGVNYVPVTADAAQQYKLPLKRGAYVLNPDGSGSAVVQGSPADQAGIREKDIIVAVGDVEIGDRGSLASLVSEYAPGDTVNLRVRRGNQDMTVRVKLAAYPS